MEASETTTRERHPEAHGGGDGDKTLIFRSSIAAPAREAFAWHTRRGAFERLIPPWESVRLKKHEGIRDGQKAVMRVSLGGPFSKKWVAEHEGYDEGRQFRDIQRKGPFAKWQHTHRFTPDGEEACTLTDEIQYRPPLGAVGRMVSGSIEKRLKKQFTYRHRITRGDVAAHYRYGSSDRTLRVAISGASGLIGSHLSMYLRAGGHEVVPMVRTRKEQKKHDEAIYWNYSERTLEADKLEGLDAVVHLAGEGVTAFRWSERKKIEMYTSRVRGTQLISETLAELDHPPEVFLCASAIGIYGDRGDEELTEESALGEGGFLTAVCRDWENATQPAAEAGIRTVPLRIGVVMARAGGALPLMLLPFWLGLGGRVGGPRQYVPWIALDDVLQSIHHLLVTEEIDGPVNLTAPRPVTTGAFAKTLAGILSRPAFLNLPLPLAKMLLGNAAEEFVLKSARVHPKRLQKTGYRFLYPDLEAALRHQLGKTLETDLHGSGQKAEPVPSKS